MSFRNFKCNFLSLFCKQLFTAHRSSTLRLNTSLKISSLQKTYIHSDKVQLTNFIFFYFILFYYTLFLRLRIHGAIKQRAFVNSKSLKDVPALNFSNIWLRMMTLLRPNQQRTGTAAKRNAPPKGSSICSLRQIICKVGVGLQNTALVPAVMQGSWNTEDVNTLDTSSVLWISIVNPASLLRRENFKTV